MLEVDFAKNSHIGRFAMKPFDTDIACSIFFFFFFTFPGILTVNPIDNKGST